MNWKRTLFFVAALSILSVFYYLKLYHQSTNDLIPAFSVEAAPRYVLEFNQDGLVKSISLSDQLKGTTLSFKRDARGNWQIVSPVFFPAEPLIIDGFVTLLKLTPRLRNLQANQLNPKDFGFDDPSLKICVEVSNHNLRCLLIGNKSVIGDGAYAKWDNEESYFLVEQVFLKSFDKTLYSVRKKQIFSLLNDEIASIHFQSSKKEFHIIHEGKYWTLQKPIESAIGEQAMNTLLTELNGLYVKEFLEGEETSKFKSKVKQALRTVRVIFRNQTEQVLIQGQEANGRDAYYARLSEPETLFLVSKGKLNHLEEAFSKVAS